MARNELGKQRDLASSSPSKSSIPTKITDYLYKQKPKLRKYRVGPG
jgi:hypothetical protein